ncbi:MAG: CBS domain-containing protein [Anaerolineae bacterium]|jgi:CBS domain-containing protein|uniref:CBS domain-containing protein n=1 Tax=Candidatus Flexifilum breve TaxID=3140694 RepID=UPI001AD0B843|nr:CBS domain-containing protein [Chloroflexota bacterium]MBK9747994.1 CBS domain-containing protein [Chloroflexota bacterium]MBN8634352.1 CBS domain-containing protein [Anaerolineae bacterium]
MLENIMVSEWMTSPVLSITPSTPIANAHQMMKDYGIRRLPVVEDNRLVGIITLGDVREASPSDATTLSIWELNYLWAQLTVDRVMSRKVLTVHPTDLVLEAARIMLEHKVSGLPVVNQRDELIGIITESDIFRMLVESKTKAIEPKP